MLVTEQVFDQLLQDAVASCQGQFLEGALQQLHTLQRILCEGKAVHQEPLALEIEGLEECIGGHRVSGERLIWLELEEGYAAGIVVADEVVGGDLEQSVEESVDDAGDLFWMGDGDVGDHPV